MKPCRACNAPLENGADRCPECGAAWTPAVVTPPLLSGQPPLVDTGAANEAHDRHIVRSFLIGYSIFVGLLILAIWLNSDGNISGKAFLTILVLIVAYVVPFARFLAP